jgi:hypothetical protein
MMNISAVTFVLLATSVPCVAQSSRTSSSVTQQYVAADLVTPRVPIPYNLQVDPAYRPLLEWMLERSPTFRRQCLRVAGNPQLTIHLYLSGTYPTRGGRALTRFSRAGGSLHAEVYVARFDNDVELIAHEIEHVIEQLDGIDLSSLAALPDTGVHQTTPTADVFETSRAAQAGLRVAREVRDTRKTD